MPVGSRRLAQGREAQERAQAERQAQERAREWEPQDEARERQAREPAAREAQAHPWSERLTPEEATRVEQLLAREPAWRAAHEATRIAALLQREQAWQAAQVEQARQLLERATGQAHTFATTALVAGRLVDRVELAGDAFGRVRDRPNHLVLVPWTQEMGQHLDRSVALQLDAVRQVTRVLAEAPRLERDRG
jgi:hypothetical protein